MSYKHVFILVKTNFIYNIIRDYYMEFQLSLDLSTRGPIISPRASRADNGRGLIKRAINKMPCYNLFITYSNPLFIEFYLKEITEF